MQYILLKNGYGIIISDERKIKAENITFTFFDAPLNSTVTFKSEKGHIYKKLSDDTHSCQLNVKGINGTLSIGLSSIVDGKPARWNCEAIFVSHDGEDTVVYAIENPNKHIAKLFDELKTIEKTIESLARKFTDLEKRVNDSFSDDFV